MIRFIINFFIIGFIYFLIWKFQPDWIDVMRSWAESAYDIIANLATAGYEKVKDASHAAKQPAGH